MISFLSRFIILLGFHLFLSIFHTYLLHRFFCCNFLPFSYFVLIIFPLFRQYLIHLCIRLILIDCFPFSGSLPLLCFFHSFPFLFWCSLFSLFFIFQSDGRQENQFLICNNFPFPHYFFFLLYTPSRTAFLLYFSLLFSALFHFCFDFLNFSPIFHLYCVPPFLTLDSRIEFL